MKYYILFAFLLFYYSFFVDTLHLSAQKSCKSSEVFTGEGTYYGATGGGNCSFDSSPNDLMVGALNNSQYANADYCGACAKIKGPKGEVKIRLVDKCPECKWGDIDLSPEAFDKIAERAAGRIPISWTFEACDVLGNLKFRFKEGSSQWWIGVQVKNHRYPITKFEFKNSKGEWINVARKDYNYFVQESGMDDDKSKVGPYNFRITDINGQVVEENNIPFQNSGDVNGNNQFPVCQPNTIVDRISKATIFTAYADEKNINIDLTLFEGEMEIEILDINGSPVAMQKTIQPWLTSQTQKNNVYQIPAENLTSGLYLIRLRKNDEIFIQKIFKP